MKCWVACLILFVSCAHERNDSRVGSYLWHKYSGEYRALCYQAYNIAKDRIENYKANSKKPLAVILDLDETVLDNSELERRNLLAERPFTPEIFNEWVLEKKATTIPGAETFLKFLKNKNIEIFFVTNRLEKFCDVTYENLLRFPDLQVPRDHLLCQGNLAGGNKEDRRQFIKSKYEVALLIGDNLRDFSGDFEGKKSSEEKIKDATKNADTFGRLFIVLPNSIYGDWMNPLYNKEKKELLKSSIEL